MATPAVFVDGTTDLEAANLNKFVSAGGTKIQVKMYYARITYNGSNFVVSSDADSAGIVTGDLTYDGTSDNLRITIAGFTNRPVVMVSPVLGATNLEVKAYAQSTTRVDVEFYAVSDGTKVTGGAVTTMDFHIIIIGF